MAEIIYYADPDMLAERAARLQVPIRLNNPDENGFRQGYFNVSPVKLATAVTPGKLEPGNAAYVLKSLERALADCQNGKTAALVTGPVNKAVINQAGMDFSGHTEWLAEKTGCKRAVMMLVAGDLRVALTTTHLPLTEVPGAITRELVSDTIRIVAKDLHARFRIDKPRLAVCGLNPHAGEQGYLGREEIDIIAPVIAALKTKGMNLTGPLPADTAFTPRILEKVDAVVAMYHDQGLPVLKYAGFGGAVNITLGLPVTRTSVDHGTALDLAATGKADAASLLAAIRCAANLSRPAS